MSTTVVKGFETNKGLIKSGSVVQVAVESNGAAAAAVTAHEGVADPHPQYLTAAEGDAAYQAAGSYQPLDSDLTTIAGLTATTDSFLQAKASAWTARTVAQVKTDLGLTGTNSGDQTITLTGDVTGSGTGSFAATVAAGAVTNAKRADMAQATVSGRAAGAGTGPPVDLTAAQLVAVVKVGVSSLAGAYLDQPLSPIGAVVSYIRQNVDNTISALSAAAFVTAIGAQPAGAVTAVSIATANGVSGTSSGGATPALTITLGAITPTSVAATGTGVFIHTSAVTNSFIQVLTIGHNSSGTPAANFGVSFGWALETSTTADVGAANSYAEWTTATHATRKARRRETVYDTAEREALRFWADGTNPRFAFAAPASAPTDADIAAGQVSWYLDETNNYLVARCKEAASTLYGVTLNKPPLITVYTSGSGTHTTATGCLYALRELVGGGGGGAGSGTTPGAATAGAATTLGVLSAGGGGAGLTTGVGGAGGTASGGNRQSSGCAGGNAAPAIQSSGGTGGSGWFGGGGVIGYPGAVGGNAGARGGGGGGAGAGVAANPGGGGGSGAYLDNFIANPASSYAYAVGAGGTGGTAGTSGFQGGDGAVGSIRIAEYF